MAITMTHKYEYDANHNGKTLTLTTEPGGAVTLVATESGDRGTRVIRIVVPISAVSELYRFFLLAGGSPTSPSGGQTSGGLSGGSCRSNT